MEWNIVEWMNVVNWSRAQFAMTAIYHWLFDVHDRSNGNIPVLFIL